MIQDMIRHNPGQADEVRKACGEAVEVIELPIDDSWIRNSGPIIVNDQQGDPTGRTAQQTRGG